MLKMEALLRSFTVVVEVVVPGERLGLSWWLMSSLWWQKKATGYWIKLRRETHIFPAQSKIKFLFLSNFWSSFLARFISFLGENLQCARPLSRQNHLPCFFCFFFWGGGGGGSTFFLTLFFFIYLSFILPLFFSLLVRFFSFLLFFFLSLFLSYFLSLSRFFTLFYSFFFPTQSKISWKFLFSNGKKSKIIFQYFVNFLHNCHLLWENGWNLHQN